MIRDTDFYEDFNQHFNDILKDLDNEEVKNKLTNCMDVIMRHCIRVDKINRINQMQMEHLQNENQKMMELLRKGA